MTDFHDDDDTQFWNDGVADRSEQLRRLGRDMTGQIKRIAKDHEDRHHFDRTREHRVVRAEDSAAVRINADDYDLEAGYAGLGSAVADPVDDARWDDVDAWVEPETGPVARRAGLVDRRLLRLGAIAAAAVVLLPIAVAIASGDDDNSDVRTNDPEAAAIASGGDAGDAGDAAASTVAEIPISAAASMTATSAGDNPADDDQEQITVSLNGVAEKGNGGDGDDAADAQAVPVEPACAGTYTVVDGDYWLRFVDSSGATLDQWLAANDATPETPMYTGDELCIPEGATAPAAPATTAPPTTAPATAAPTTAALAPETTATTAAPVTTAAPTTAAPTTAAPTTAAPTTAAPTTAAPTTAAPAPPPPAGGPSTESLCGALPTSNGSPPGVAGPAEVEALIRQIWPDDIEVRALCIAKREANLRPDLNNYCCYGVFALYFDYLSAELRAPYGVDEPSDLWDARTNISIAYDLYRIAGWDPWSQTDPGSG